MSTRLKIFLDSDSSRGWVGSSDISSDDSIYPLSADVSLYLKLSKEEEVMTEGTGKRVTPVDVGVLVGLRHIRGVGKYVGTRVRSVGSSTDVERIRRDAATFRETELESDADTQAGGDTTDDTTDDTTN